MTTRSKEREQFLADVLITAIESGDYGNWMRVDEYEAPEDDPAGTYAVIREARWAAGTTEDPDAAPQVWRVDLDLIARGLGVIRDAEPRKTPIETRTALKGTPDEHTYTVGGELVLHNAKTGDRLYMGDAQRKNIMLADRTNLDEGDIDVIDTLAILECACYGRVVYA